MMIRKCLQMADDEKLASIAFPTVGCGKLGYSANMIANCFVRAAADTSAAVQVGTAYFLL